MNRHQNMMPWAAWMRPLVVAEVDPDEDPPPCCDVCYAVLDLWAYLDPSGREAYCSRRCAAMAWLSARVRARMRREDTLASLTLTGG